MSLETDIVDRIRSDFDAAVVATAINELATSGKTGRLARCIVVGAGGSLERLRDLIGMAEIDDRDVILAGEYDGAMRRVWDLRVSFLLNSPDDFWISELAITMHKHGYRLLNLETHTISTPPYAGTHAQGRVIFGKGGRTITIEKRDGQWSVDGTTCNLAAFGLDAPLADEKRFRIQLDFLLSRTDAEQSGEREPPMTRVLKS